MCVLSILSPFQWTVRTKEVNGLNVPTNRCKVFYYKYSSLAYIKYRGNYSRFIEGMPPKVIIIYERSIILVIYKRKKNRTAWNNKWKFEWCQSCYFSFCRFFFEGEKNKIPNLALFQFRLIGFEKKYIPLIWTPLLFSLKCAQKGKTVF